MFVAPSMPPSGGELGHSHLQEPPAFVGENDEDEFNPLRLLRNTVHRLTGTH